MSSQVAQEVGERWVWILDIIFGSVIGFGFQKLEEGLRASARASTTAFLKHLLMAMGFLGFVIYDIGVYHILIKTFPYDFSRPSAARYVLDLVMAFLLMIILVRGLSSDAGENLFEILIALSLWHLAAICWHFAAAVQMHNEIPKVSTFLPHLVFIGLYWSFFGVWYLGMIHGLHEKRVDAKAFLVLLGGLLLCISIWRSHQMIRTFVNTAERDIASQSFGNPASRPTVPESSLNPPRPLNEGSECRLHDTFCISFYPLRIGMDTAPVIPAFPPTH